MEASGDSLFCRAKYPDYIGFKAPRDFRPRAQQLAVRDGLTLAEVLRRAVERGLAGEPQAAAPVNG
jgi:hypothetical protein